MTGVGEVLPTVRQVLKYLVAAGVAVSLVSTLESAYSYATTLAGALPAIPGPGPNGPLVWDEYGAEVRYGDSRVVPLERDDR